MLVPSPTQATALRAWLLTVLNLDDQGAEVDPPPFSEAQVFPGERDHPRYARFCRFATVAITGRGLARSHEITDPGEPEQALVERRGEHREWTVSITVCTRLDPTDRRLADEAGQHLQRALGAREGYWARDLANVGMGVLRVGEIVDAARLLGTTEHETRAVVTLTLACGWTASTPVPWVETVTGTGQVGDLDPLPFDSASAEEEI